MLNIICFIVFSEYKPKFTLKFVFDVFMYEIYIIITLHLFTHTYKSSKILKQPYQRFIVLFLLLNKKFENQFIVNIQVNLITTALHTHLRLPYLGLLSIKTLYN